MCIFCFNFVAPGFDNNFIAFQAGFYPSASSGSSQFDLQVISPLLNRNGEILTDIIVQAFGLLADVENG